MGQTPKTELDLIGLLSYLSLCDTVAVSCGLFFCLCKCVSKQCGYVCVCLTKADNGDQTQENGEGEEHYKYVIRTQRTLEGNRFLKTL